MAIEATNHWGFLKGVTSAPVAEHGGKVIRFSNGKEAWFLKQRPSLDLCEKDVAVASICKKHNVPAGLPLATDTGESCLHDGDHWWVLAPELPGKELTDVTRENATLIGAAIAAFQNAFRDEPIDTFPRFDSSLKSLLFRLERLGDREPDAIQMASLFTGFPSERDLKWGIIHRDPHEGNMRFEGGRLTGIYDFDQTRRGPLIYDPCYASTCRLQIAWNEEDKPELWLDYFSGLMEGFFEARCPHTDERHRIFNMLLQIQLKWIIWLRETGQDKAAEMNRRHLYWLSERKPLIESALGL